MNDLEFKNRYYELGGLWFSNDTDKDFAEFIVNANPQVIMLADSSSKDIEKRPGWHKINAVINRRICVFTPPENNILSRPGPRIPEAANIMANCLKKMYPQ